MSYVSLNLTYRHIISKSESLSKKGKIYRNFVYGLVVIRSYIGCWYPVRRKWNQEVWWWRWRGLGTVCWGSTITLIIRWRGGQWGEPDQSSSLDLTLHLSRLVPTFMFGLTGDLLDSLYGGPDKIPTRGMLTATTGWFGTGSICSSC